MFSIVRNAIVFVVLLITPLFAQQGWQRITPPNANLSFANSNFWSNDSGCIGEFITLDGGKTWQLLELPPTTRVDTGQYQSALSWSDLFISRTSTYILGGFYTLSDPSNYRYTTLSPVLKTHNHSWDFVPWFQNQQYDCSVGNKIYFKDERRSFIILDEVTCGYGGAGSRSAAKIMVTFNGWDSIISATHTSINQYLLHYYESADFINDSIVVISTTKGLLFGNKNSGINPVVHPIILDGDTLSDTYESSSLKAMGDSVLLLYFSNKLLRSTDFGKSWAITIDSCKGETITPVNNTVVYTTFDRYIDPNTWSYVAKSTDAGLTWKTQLQCSNTAFYIFAAPSDSVAYVYGRNGLYKTMDGGGTTLSIISQPTPHRSIDCYPNPATSKVTISFPRESINRDLFVFDALGRECFNQPITHEQTEVEVPTANFLSGLYFIRVGSETVQLIISK